MGCRWDVRIARARQLAAECPAVAQILNFYAELAGFQKSLASSLPPSRPALRRGSPKFAAPEPPAANEGGRPSASAIDLYSVVSAVPAFLSWLQRAAPARLAAVAADMMAIDPAEWHTLFDSYWTSPGHELPSTDETMLFVLEAVLQPFVEAEVIRRPVEVAQGAGQLLGGARCPVCSGKPIVGVFREDGQAVRRSLVCGLCLHEWGWPRVACPGCGETRFDVLEVFTADEIPAARVDACGSCRAYLKTLDLTKDGLMVPIVDDLATVSLDLWAREQGYTKLRPNLLLI